MPLELRDAEIVDLVTQLAERQKKSAAEVLRSAVEHEWQRELEADRMREKIAAFHAKVRLIANPEGGLPADKAFIDSLYEDD